jgi:homoserine dehydrogenase
MPSERAPNTPYDFLLIQLGVGQIGAAVVSLVQQLTTGWSERSGLSVHYYALADSSGFAVPGPKERLLPAQLLTSIAEAHIGGQSLRTLPNGRPAGDWHVVLDQAIQAGGRPNRIIVVDCAVGHDTTDLLLAARAAGAHVVLCNKDPLTGPYAQFRALQGDLQSGSLHLGATVGAGLPITGAVAAAKASGDSILELHAVASGSLGQLCSNMSQGADFADALEHAVAAGYCEPDPRVDLSGHDVARKLLILARLAGHSAELAGIEVESLIPPGAASLSRDDFLAALPSWREHLRDRFTTARATGHVLRYVGTIDAHGLLRASLREIDQDNPFARGHGPENVFVLRTERYQQHPLIIAGPGAGVAVTAGAVVGDILRAAGVL